MIHIHTPEPDVSSGICSTLYVAYMGTRATTTTTAPIQPAAATAWGYLRLRPMPLAPIGALLLVASGICGVKREPERGHRGSQMMRMRRKGAEFEAWTLLRTFVGRPAATQWDVAGEAPAPQLNDRSRPRPQRGNGRERLPPLAAHRRMRPLHDLQPCRAAEAGARAQASIEGFEPTFSTCSDARSSTNCCKRWAASA